MRYVVKQFLKGSNLFVSLPRPLVLESPSAIGCFLGCVTRSDRSGFIVLVVSSPLLALMKNQVDLLQKRGV